jgi:hypothetical protein
MGLLVLFSTGEVTLFAIEAKSTSLFLFLSEVGKFIETEK